VNEFRLSIASNLSAKYSILQLLLLHSSLALLSAYSTASSSIPESFFCYTYFLFASFPSPFASRFEEDMVVFRGPTRVQDRRGKQEAIPMSDPLRSSPLPMKIRYGRCR